MLSEFVRAGLRFAVDKTQCLRQLAACKWTRMFSFGHERYGRLP